MVIVVVISGGGGGFFCVGFGVGSGDNQYWYISGRCDSDTASCRKRENLTVIEKDLVITTSPPTDRPIGSP